MQKKLHNPVLNLRRIDCWIYSEKIHTEIHHPMKNSWATCRVLILEESTYSIA